MNLEFSSCPKPETFNKEILPLQKPLFLSYHPDIEAMKTLTEKYAHVKKILVIGHGGSITTFMGFYEALKEESSKRVYFLNTVDPDYIWELKQNLHPAESLVIAISKSGETTTQIEALTQFLDYPLLVIAGKGSTLANIGNKVGAEIFDHPPIGGRYTGLTEVALLPAAICGIPVSELIRGAEDLYAQFYEDNIAWKTASVLYELEKNGYVDVFLPFYSHGLYSFSTLIVQLCHESFGKALKGQTYAAFEAPESQHHTNQRFFGGQKNMAGLFISQDVFNHLEVTNINPSLHSIPFKNGHLEILNKIPLEKSMHFELQGTLEDAKIHGIPTIHLQLLRRSSYETGFFVAFWHLFAVYSSLLRGVNPFDQPQVENSKTISYNKRLSFKGVV